jgi:plasmid stability protein
MATMTVRNLPDDVYARVRFLAKERGISAEALARDLLDRATQPSECLGTTIVSYFASLGISKDYEAGNFSDAAQAADFG